MMRRANIRNGKTEYIVASMPCRALSFAKNVKTFSGGYIGITLDTDLFCGDALVRRKAS